MAPSTRHHQSTGISAKSDIERTPARSHSKKRASHPDIASHSSPGKRSSPAKKPISDLTPAKPPVRSIVDENETPKVQRSGRRVAFELEDDPASSADEEDEAEADLMAQLEDANRPERHFLNLNNPQDAYFVAHSKFHRTSANLFSSRPDWEPFTVSSYLDALDNSPTSESPDLQTLREYQRKRWPQWQAELEEGFSLLFHGLGSKRVALNEFVEEALVQASGWEGLVVNGFQAGSQVADVLGGLEGILNEESGPSEGTLSGRINSFEGLEARARRLCDLLTSFQTPVCLLIHNLDGRGFRTMRAQTIISMLAAQPNIHLLATIDHIYAPILFPSSLASARPDASADPLGRPEPGSYGNNFLYHHLPTHLPYTLEAILDGTLSNLLPTTIFPSTVSGANASRSDLRQAGPATAKAIIHVLSSLTPKAKSLFRLLAQHQIEVYSTLSSAQQVSLDQHLKKGTLIDETPEVAMASRTLFELARTEFVASVESQMTALLIEFRDHGIIDGRTEPPDSHRLQERVGMVENDEEWLWIGLGRDELVELVEHMNEI